MDNFKNTLLLPAIVTFVEEIPPLEVAHVVACLVTEDGEKLKGHLNTLARTARTERFYLKLDYAWKSCSVQAGDLAFALEAAMKTAKLMRAKQKITTVWTGPATESVPLRRTEQVLCEIIDGAKENLLIVSFVAYKAEDVLSAIKRALKKNIRVIMVLETEKESGGKVSFDQAAQFKKDLPALELYTWPLEKREKDARGNHGAIHAKCCVADKKVAFVSSANLTDFALELNMEMGLLVHGGNIALAITEHFEELIRRDILMPILPPKKLF